MEWGDRALKKSEGPICLRPINGRLKCILKGSKIHDQLLKRKAWAKCENSSKQEQ